MDYDENNAFDLFDLAFAKEHLRELTAGSEGVGKLTKHGIAVLLWDLDNRIAALEAKPTAPVSGRHTLHIAYYPCGCTASGGPNLPDYCGTHGVATRESV